MSDSTKLFIESHRLDDIIYVLNHREYFGLSDAECSELRAWVFEAIDKASNSE